MTRVLIAPDKFKGSLTAADVADTLSEGLVRAGLQTVVLPLADGGDGSVAAAVASGFASRQVVVKAATGRDHVAAIAVASGTAVVEIANTCGLSTLGGLPLAPMTASSFGVGQAIRHALELGVTRIVVGLGGSASSDAGIGMLAALGYRFLDFYGREVTPIAANLCAIHRVDRTGVSSGLGGVELIVASDVTNPLIGPQGAAPVYGPQKGAGITDVEALENGYDCLIRAFADSGQQEAVALAQMTGAGAAGGCGFAAALTGARLVSGADFFLDLLNFDTHCAAADIVITGEGCLDPQTLNGKLPSVIAHRSRDKPVVAVVGISRLDVRATPFTRILAAADFSVSDTAGNRTATLDALGRIADTIGGWLNPRSAPAYCSR